MSLPHVKVSAETRAEDDVTIFTVTYTYPKMSYEELLTWLAWAVDKFPAIVGRNWRDGPEGKPVLIEGDDRVEG